MGFKIPDTPEELFRQGSNSFAHLTRWVPTLVFISVILGFILSSFYSIDPDEVGIIRRFGKYDRTTQPGLHWKFPFGIDRLDKVKVKRIFKEEFGFRTTHADVKSEYASRGFPDESLMLTGDLNVLDVTWIVQFKIKDPVQLLFNIRDPRQTVRDISQSVMRKVIGDSSVNAALTTLRDEINVEVQKEMQQILDSYKSGIEVETIKLQDVNPPDEVKPSFNEVNEAKQEQEKVVNQSWESYNKAIPKARGEAERMIREAEGFALSRVNQAHGDVANFQSTWEAYKDSKDVTRRRLYLETIAEILPRAGHIYILNPKTNGVLPLLNLQQP